MIPVDYIKKNFAEHAQALVNAADEVVGKSFAFTLRWDMERTYVPIVFDGDIDWLYQPGDDPEWVFAFNRMKFWIVLGQAYALTGDEKYKDAFREQLESWVRTVKKDDPASKNAWRSIEVGLRLEYWQKAFAYFGDFSDDLTALYQKSVREQADVIMGIWDDYNLMSNWGVLANHGLFLAGALLGCEEYVNESVRRLELELNMQVMRDGFHWEQSPMYHNEVLHCYLDVVQYAKRYGIKLSDNFLNTVKAMCVADVYASKPDHHELCMGDSDDIDQRDILTRAAWLFNDSEMRSRGYDAPDFDSAWEMGAEGIDEYLSIPPKTPVATDKYFADSGNMYFRSGWNDADAFLHFHCGTLGAGHGHADKLHVDIFAGGEDILIDAGRHSYVFGKESRVAFKELKAHNTIRVSNVELYDCLDSWECANLTRAVNQRFYSDEDYGYAEGGHLGYGFLTNRRVVYIKPNVIVLIDEFYAEGDNSYEQFFHFSDKHDVVRESGVCGYGDKACLQFVSSADMSQTLGESVFSRRYNEKFENVMLTNAFSANGFVCVFTVISLGANAPTVEKLPVTSTFKGITFPDDTLEAIRVNGYTLVVAHKEFASPTDTFRAGGCVGFGNCVVFAPNEREIGRVLLW